MAPIPVAALLGTESLALLIAIQALTGLLSSFFQAAWVPYLPGLIGRGHLPSANSRIVASNSVSQVVAPSVSGTMVGVLGGPVTLVIDAASYLWSALFIARIEHREPPSARHTGRCSLRREMAEGLGVLVRSPLLRALTGSNATIVLAGHLFLAIYPLYVLDTLGLSARGVGLVYAAGGIGGLLGSFVTTTSIRRLGTGATITWAAVLFGVFGLTIPLAVLAPHHALPLVVFAEFAQWMTLVVFEIAEGSLRQAVTPDHLLGRVAASDQVLAAGLQPVGAFLGGVLGQVFGVQKALLIGVAGMFCAGAWVYLVAGAGRRRDADGARPGPWRPVRAADGNDPGWLSAGRGRGGWVPTGGPDRRCGPAAPRPRPRADRRRRSCRWAPASSRGTTAPAMAPTGCRAGRSRRGSAGSRTGRSGRSW